MVAWCLRFDPETRPKIEEVLAHPYFKAHHDVAKEPKCIKRMPADVRHKKMAAIREAIYERVEELNEDHKLVYQGVNVAEQYNL